MFQMGSKDWYKEHLESGMIAEAGAVKKADSDNRIGVYGAIKQNAPEVMEFLGKMAPGDEIIAEQASMLTGGRTGIENNVAALRYLKTHEDIWISWVPPVVADKVKAAIKAGKASLLNRKCIPGGGSGMPDVRCAG